jgi:hypothetical protein
MLYAILDGKAILYDEEDGNLAIYISRKQANAALVRVLKACPEAEVIKVSLRSY